MKKYITKIFTFEAAHSLSKTRDKKNSKLHGHSFHVEFTIKGRVKRNGMIKDFKDLDMTADKLKKILDHSYLNEIEGIGLPTLENIGSFIWMVIKKENIGLSRLQISRKTCKESFVIEL